MKFKSLLLVVGFIPVLSLAQTTPNMLGTWNATSNAAVMGTAAHHQVPNKQDGEIYFNKVPLKMVIDRQEGVNFSGTISSVYYKEVILGAIAPDLQSGVMVDEDGSYTFKINDSTTIQVCYVQVSKPKVANCWLGKR
ncbi:MAG: hypothetical protein WCP25_11260 [Polynucleobacter sp.]